MKMNSIHFWWKMRLDQNDVVVRSDDNRFPILGMFPFDPQGGEPPTPKMRRELASIGVDFLVRRRQAESAIRAAENLIADLQAGRVSPHRLARAF